MEKPHEKEGDKLTVSRMDELGNLSFPALEKDFHPMKDFFRIQRILDPAIEVKEELKLLWGRERDQGKGILFPYLLNGYQGLKLGNLLDELLGIS